MVVSDNLRAGITKACFYELAVNRSYAEMAANYGTAVVPARPYRARDKAKVEVAVTRFIIAKLRNRCFFSLCELNAAIAELVAQINNRVSRHLGASRRYHRAAPELSAWRADAERLVWIPAARATSEGIAPGSMASATTRSISARGQRRRRCTDVITAMRLTHSASPSDSPRT
jgi:hypothetical protein